MADSTDSFEFTSQCSEMFEDKSVELPDLEERQVWDSPNVMVSYFFSNLKGFMNMTCMIDGNFGNVSLFFFFRKSRINKNGGKQQCGLVNA